MDKVGIAIVGYVAAVTVAVLMATLFALLPTVLPDKGAWGSFYAYTRDLSGMLALGFAIVFVGGLPGFLIILVFAAAERWKTWLPFSIAGGINALVTVLAIKIYVVTSMPPASFLIANVLGGCAGGFAYWATAGRFLAKMPGHP